jgi:LmbE family N-acetylglucosaminyl deacetylase
MCHVALTALHGTHMYMTRFKFPVYVLLLLLLLSSGSVLPAQLRVHTVGEHPGEVSLHLVLRQLGSIGTYMETTAHPDDENNALLAELGLGQGMRAVLVSATRGDGGQNEIGPEIFQALGVLRTEELHAAHRIDGAEQYFTRAIDFGYSFSVEESLEKWGHEEILRDFVHHIRAIRPDVIVGFICGGEGGGQHHQATARLTVEAFRAAADPARFPDQIQGGLRPWQAARVFCTDASGFGPRAQQKPPTPDQVLVPASTFDPLLGRTYGEIGTEARSMHKCQGMSQLLPLPGGAPGRVYRLRDTIAGEASVAPKTLFEGIDIRLTALSRFAGARPPEALTAALAAMAGHVDAAAEAVRARGQAAAATPLAAGLHAVRQLRASLGSLGLDDVASYEIDFRLEQKERQFQSALALSQGLRIEALADDGLVVAGQPIRVTLTGGANAGDGVMLNGVSFDGFDGTAAPCAGTLVPGEAVTCQADLRIPADVPLSTPYWTPRADAARYDFEPGVPFGVPFRPSPFSVTAALTIAGADVRITRVVEYRYGDLLAGEKRMELAVVPDLAVRVSPDIIVVPAAARGEDAARHVDVTVINQHTAAGTAGVRLEAPAGWQVSPASAPVRFAREDESVTVGFRITPPAAARAGDFTVSASATREGGGARFAHGYTIVEYPHIRRRHVVEPAQARAKVIDVSIAPGLRVGYITGVGDRVPDAIAQLGAELRMIEPRELAAGDLSRYDVIVAGVRAYEARPDLRANNHRLLTYVEQGGTVLVNYNKFEFNEAQYGPFPAKNTSARVTDEHAPIEILVPEHPVFTTPNRLGPSTWDGWVQERGTYFLTDTDPRYVHLVQATDPFPYNAGPKRGALVYASHGKGHWVYLGLGLWRQLPAGTDGAYQLLANLLSLGGRERR